jgi:hypothetical protein
LSIVNITNWWPKTPSTDILNLLIVNILLGCRNTIAMSTCKHYKTVRRWYMSLPWTGQPTLTRWYMWLPSIGEPIYIILVWTLHEDFAKRHFFKVHFSNKDLDVTKISNMLHHYLIQFNQKSCLTIRINHLILLPHSVSSKYRV